MTYDNEFRILFKFAMDNNGQKVVAEQPIDIGLIQDIKTKYSISTSSMGIPTQPAQNSFQMDLGVTRTYTFEYRRVNPDTYENTLGEIVNGEYVPSNPKKWSNGFWLYIMKKFLVNRWQMETDGCKIYYLKESANYPTIPAVNCYISDFKSNPTVGDVQTIEGTITFTIGSTNILKESMNYTVIFESNYSSTGVSGVEDDDTNMVRVTNNNELAKPELPTGWCDRAITLTGWGDVAGSYWSYDKNGTSKIEDDVNVIQLTEQETTIYAIWRSSQ